MASSSSNNNTATDTPDTNGVENIHSVKLALDEGRGYLTDMKSLPNLKDLSPETITKNVHLINKNAESERLKFVLEKLTTHLHDFARETQLQTHEWKAAIEFLTRVGQISSPIRQEFILLSDIFGLSMLVDSISHPVPEGCSEPTVLGPFHTDDAETFGHDGSIASEGKGENMWVTGKITDKAGKPVVGATVEVWETDENGLYDTQYKDRDHPDCRGIVRTDENGHYQFKAVVPVPYPIPGDGPVGELLSKLKRHTFRPSHMHFQIEHKDFEPLVSAIYKSGDPFESSDAVFGVKSSLIQDFEEVHDVERAKEMGFKTTPVYVLDRDWVLATSAEIDELRAVNYEKAGIPKNLRA